MSIPSTSIVQSGSSPVQSPVQTSSPAPDPTRVPKGQLERTRDKMPTGWSNDGGHNGFKDANVSRTVAGYYLAAVNPADVPRGRQ